MKTPSTRSAAARPALRPHPLALALASASLLSLLPGLDGARAQALPSGASVVHGQANIVTSGKQMTVTNSNGAIVNWQTFSIGNGNTVRFDQPNAASQVLNRVVGNDPSSILGSLSSNGRVWLLNPNGVLFGQGARVDVAGLVASSLNIANNDWLAGRYSFSDSIIGDGGVVNQGELRTTLGGRIALIAGSGGVKNEGVIDASGGQVMLAAGQSVDLVDTGAPNLTLRVSAPKGEALNLGSISAAGGRIDVQAALVNQQGIVRAGSLQSGPGGEVVLGASQALNLSAGSSTTAGGASGGSVTLDAGSHGTLLAGGSVDATGASTKGGQVKLLGQQVGLLDGVRVDASGATGGGEVFVGGGAQGRDKTVPNARAVYIGEKASIAADAKAQGDGGRIIVWSDEATRAHGAFSARGGALGGDGGFIETSGGWLSTERAAVDTTAAAGKGGKAGLWLLDPNNIAILNVAPAGTVPPPQNITPGPNFTSTNDNAYVLASQIRASLDAGNNVSVSTSTGGTNGQAGDIDVVNASIFLTGNSDVSLSLTAHRNITFNNASIFESSSTGSLSVNLTAGTTTNGAVSLAGTGSSIQVSGRVVVSANTVSLSGGSSINASASGDAIIIKGVGNSNTSVFQNTTTGVALNAPNGRFLIYATDPSSSATWNPGGLAYNYRQYGVSLASGSPAAPVGTGNGALFSVAPTATLTANPTKVYDGGTAISFFSSAATGLMPGDDAFFPSEQGNGNFDNKDAGTNKPITLLPGSLAFSDVNARPVYGYQVVVNGTVTPRGLSLSGFTALDKTYDGNTVATINTNPLVGLVGSENFTSAATGTFDTKDVGVNKPVAVNYILGGGVNGALASNYTLSGPAGNATTASITRADLTITGVNAANKVYDGNTNATLTGGTINGLVAGETFASFGNAFFYPDENVGTNKTVFVNYALGGGSSGALASNYNVSGPSSLSASITPRPLTLAGAVASNKVYDGGTLANVNGGTLSGLVGSQSFQTTSTGSFDTKDVGNGKTVFVTTTLGAGSGGALASNYIAPGVGATTANITPRALTVSGVTAQDKVYDGNTTATLSGGALSGLVAGESFATSLSGNFIDKDAGSNKQVLVSVALGGGSNGALASNYSTSNATSTTASITPRALSFGSVVAGDKTYDGNTVASFSSGGLIGLVGSESFGSSISGNFDTKDAGANKTVSYTQSIGAGSNGALAGNYVLPSGSSGTTTASITPRALTLGGVTAADKVYDGNRVASVSGGTLNGLVGGETFSAAGITGSFDTKDVGTNKGVAVDVQLINGSNGALASNYTISSNAVTTASITPRALTLTGVTASGKLYDGTTTATLTPGTLVGLVAGESFGTTAIGSFVTKDAGIGKTVNYSHALGNGSGGALASNYSFGSSTGGTTTATIAPRKVDFGNIIVANKTYDGTTLATLASGGLVNLVGNESFATSVLASFGDKNVGSGKAVAVAVTVGAGSNGALASNYILPTGANATGNVTPRGVAVSGFTAAGKVYDATRNTSASGWTLTNLVSGDAVNVASGTATFADGNVGSNKAVAGQATALGGADAGNYAITQPNANSSASITPATLTYVAAPASSITGAPLPAFGGSVTGFVGGESQAGATSGTTRFTTPAFATSPVGQYAINGSGLSAQNYVFTQAAANATALTMGPPQVAINQDAPAATQNALDAVEAATRPEFAIAPTAVDAPPSGRTLDAFPALQFGTGAQALSFRSLPVETMTQTELSTLLSARDRYKKSVFSEALSRLEQNPDLADVGACKSAEQVDSGTCLITEALKREIQAARAADESKVAGGAPRPTPTPAPTPTPTPTPTPAPAPAPSAAPSVAALPAPVIVARAAPLNEVIAGTLERRQATSVRASLPQIERKIAVLIGSDQYADQRIPKLDNAVGDARAVGALLESNLGYQTVRIENGSKATMIRTLNRLALEVGPRDSVVIYYAGHGELVASTGLGYWQPANADSTKPESWLSNADIGRLLAQIGASQVALISDSCYSGSLVSNERIRTSGTLDPQQVLARKSVVVMSSGGNEPVFDQGKDGHSPFAWNLMRNLQQVSTWQPGGNVFERVRFAVAKELPQRPQYGAFQQAGHQPGGDYLFEQRQ